MFHFSRRIKLLTTFAALIATFALATFPAAAQGDRPDLLAAIYLGPVTHDVIFGGDGAQLNVLEYDSFLQSVRSPNNRWVAAYGMPPGASDPAFAYRILPNGRPVSIPVTRGHQVFSAMFNSASAYLIYVTAATDPGVRDYVLGVIQLSTGKRIEFAGTSGPASIFGANMLATPIAFDGRFAVMTAFVPFVDGNFGGLFRVDLQTVDSAPAGRYVIPATVVRLVDKGQVTSAVASPDGRNVAVLFFDATNPPQGLQSEGPGFVANGLAVVNVANRTMKVIAKAGAGQVLETASWSPNGQQVYVSGGAFNNSSHVVTPKLFASDIDTGQVSELGILSPDANEAIYQVQVCGGTAFFVGSVSGGTGVSLYAAQLNNVTGRTAIISNAQSVQLEGCVGL